MSIRVPDGGTLSVPRGGTLRYARTPESVMHHETLSAYARLVYGEMALWVFQGKTCSIGVRKMAKNLHFSKTTVVEAIEELVKAGVISASKRGAGKRTVYVLLSPVFGQKQGQETVVVSGPRGAKRMVSVGPEKKTA